MDGEFIKGPLPLKWWGRACQASAGRTTLATALSVWFQAGVSRSRRDLRLTNGMVKRFGVMPSGKGYALAALEAAGLLQVERRGRKSPLVTLREAGGTRYVA